MRILMLAQFYTPIIGGEERHVQDLSVELAARGHDVAVATLWHAGTAEFEVDRGVRVYRMRGTLQRGTALFKEAGRRHAPPFPDPELMLALRSIVAHERPQIVHAHNWLVHSFLPLKPWSGAKLVMSLHDYSLVCAKKSLVYREEIVCSGPGFAKCLSCASNHYGVAKGVPTVLTNWAMGAVEAAAVDMFITVSQATAVGNGLTGSRLPFEVIPNFLPQDEHDVEETWSDYLAQLPNEPFLLFVGDLRRFKGIDVLLQAYTEIHNAPPLVLIGRTCSDTPAVLPPNVIALHDWPHGAVMAAWQRSLVGLLPSIGAETFGIAALEAMACGRPVVVSRIGGIPDVVVDGESGFLLPPGDVSALRQAIERLLVDSALRERMGQSARRRAAEFRTSAVVPRIEHMYHRLLLERLAGVERAKP